MRLIQLIFCLLFGSQALFAQASLQVQNTKSYKLVSKINNKEYFLGISVPEDYSASNKYPVHFILDGYYAAGIAHGVHRTLDFYKEIEDIIVVTIAGIEKNNKEFLVNRWADLTFTNDPRFDTVAVKNWDLPAKSLLSGNGRQFLEIIKTEIIPFIEKKYSTNGKKGISGHSLGGLFVGNLMFEANDIFEKFGINSPSFKGWNKNDIRIAESAFAERHKDLKVKAILTFGGLEDAVRISDLKEYEALLKSHYSGIEITSYIFEGETHSSVIAAMISRNMSYLYANKAKSK